MIQGVTRLWQEIIHPCGSAVRVALCRMPTHPLRCIPDALLRAEISASMILKSAVSLSGAPAFSAAARALEAEDAAAAWWAEQSRFDKISGWTLPANPPTPSADPQWTVTIIYDEKRAP